MLSFHPMQLDEALKKFMEVEPEEYQAEMEKGGEKIGSERQLKYRDSLLGGVR